MEESNKSVELKPTREAMARQLQLVDEQIERAGRYADYGAELIARGTGGREVSLCITKLQEARMWANEARRILEASE
jgi:hypothetical protein